MIPKIIHYIWIGGKPLPEIAVKCIKSWKKFLPNFEIKRWDESNLDIDKFKFVRQAYDTKKWAYASDVLRFDILNIYGGLYLDIDVEFIKPLDESFLKNKAFFAFEKEDSIAPGLIFGAEKGVKEIEDLLNIYKNLSFLDEEGKPILKTVCIISTDYFKQIGLRTDNSLQIIDDIAFYPTEYFCPKSLSDGKIRLTKKTFSIHHYLASWLPFRKKIKGKILQFIKRIVGEKNVEKIKLKMRKNKDDNS
ncbi:MAG: glycosyl transferase [Clostridia bacterium]|nr:glycosyl transferase [Clostridia bacterium]